MADVTGWTPGGVFYVQGALWEATLCLTLFVLLSAARRSLWRLLARCACLIGIAEACMMASCQMAIAGRPPPNTTQCDFVTGLPVFAVTTTLEVAAVLVVTVLWLWKVRES